MHSISNQHVWLMVVPIYLYFIKEYLIRLLEDKLTYLRSCKTKLKNKCQTYRKRKSFIFTPRPPVLQPPVHYDNSLATFEMNLMILQGEEKKPNPNREMVMDLMEKTFFIRRQNILKTTTSVASLLKMFPSLRNHIQVSVHAHMNNICTNCLFIENNYVTFKTFIKNLFCWLICLLSTNISILKTSYPCILLQLFRIAHMDNC